MNVLTIREPYATLILNRVKTIETRSWKTNYRGELFIHASGKSLAKEFLNNDYVINLIDGIDMNYGNIICRGNLVDCVYMDESFLNAIKEDEKEYNLGLSEIGRYAWIFEDVEPIYPIPVKGQLNIWNYDGEYEIMNTKKHR